MVTRQVGRANRTAEAFVGAVLITSTSERAWVAASFTLPMSLARTLRVHFVTEDDPFYVLQFFEVFFEEYPRDEFEIVGVTIQAPFRERRAATARRILSLYGPVDFSHLLARFAARKVRRRSVGALARGEGIPLVPTTSVNEPAFVEEIRSLRPDVIVSVAAPEIFREEILESARLGCINIHSGRLPAYRGMMPTFWQMLSGESHATVTVHEMAREVDAGAILGTVEYPIRERDSLDHVITETKREGARLMIRVLRQLEAGAADGRPLDMATAGYYSFPQAKDAKEFRRRGHRLL
jgi:methionyl-tRNA formyltransferase